MQGPKNVGGVVFATLMGALIVGICVAFGVDGTTRRGVPVWLLLVLGMAAWLAVIVESWRKPRRPFGDQESGPRVTRGGKAVLAGFALWWFVPIVAILVGALVGVFR